MNIMTVLGSPKKKGNTANVLALLEEMIPKNHEIDRLNIVDCDIRGCLGCLTCQGIPDEMGCVQKDDALRVFERIISSDVVIYATPLYCWSFSSQMKALIDRHLCLATGHDTPEYKSLVNGKRTVLLVTCAGPIENNADLIQQIFDRLNDYLQCDVIGKYIVPFCTTPDSLSSEAIDTAKKMHKDILGS
jgi:multimeric flavodoxin WrbA